MYYYNYKDYFEAAHIGPDPLFSNFIRSKKLNCTTKTKQNIVQKVDFKLAVFFAELVGIRLSSGGPPSM